LVLGSAATDLQVVYLLGWWELARLEASNHLQSINETQLSQHGMVDGLAGCTSFVNTGHCQ
jgi:hypothetical protein